MSNLKDLSKGIIFTLLGFFFATLLNNFSDAGFISKTVLLLMGAFFIGEALHIFFGIMIRMKNETGKKQKSGN